jgi:hypothetical protein
VVGKLEYAHLGDVWELRGGFERKLRFDSYEALVGDEVDGESIGAARENRFYGAVGTKRGSLEARIEPYIGWVSADGADENLLVGTRGRVGYRWLERSTFDLIPFYEAEVMHYGDDAYGFDPAAADPAPGGYYSPQIFVEQTPGLALSYRIGERQFLEVEAGPSFQYQEDSESSGFEFGAKAWLSYVLFLGDSFYWSLEPRFTRFGDVYTRGEVMTSLTFKF